MYENNPSRAIQVHFSIFYSIWQGAPPPPPPRTSSAKSWEGGGADDSIYNNISSNYNNISSNYNNISSNYTATKLVVDLTAASSLNRWIVAIDSNLDFWRGHSNPEPRLRKEDYRKWNRSYPEQYIIGNSKQQKFLFSRSGCLKTIFRNSYGFVISMDTDDCYSFLKFDTNFDYIQIRIEQKQMAKNTSDLLY